MISKETLTPEWIDKVSKANRNSDKILVEKVVRALLLLEGLAKVGLPFTFKGGTALMLLMDSTKRLSIDIDIVLDSRADNLDELLQQVAGSQGFNRFELQDRGKPSKIEKAHYKFFYTPVHQTHGGEDYVLLDILFESSLYTNVSNLSIKSHFVISDDMDIQIQVPSPEDILGDKLTAYAPNTTGIPYSRRGNSMSMEIIKQLYDIGNLFDLVKDLEIIKATYAKIVSAEIEYRELEGKAPKDVLEDTYQTSLCITLRGADGIGDFGELQKGIQRIAGFIFSESYHLEKAIVHAAKAAYLSQLINTNKTEIEKYNDPTQIENSIIGLPHNTRLQKLRKSNPEAYFYWWKATQLRGDADKKLLD